VAAREPKVGEGGGSSRIDPKFEEVPNIPGTKIVEEQVINILSMSTRGADSQVRQAVPKPSSIGREASLLCKPAENLTLQRCNTPPNLARQIISLKMHERVGIENFVRKHFVRETTES
jgi:hypothetical protein